MRTDAERVAAPSTPVFFRAPTGNLESILSAGFLREEATKVSELATERIGLLPLKARDLGQSSTVHYFQLFS